MYGTADASESKVEPFGLTAGTKIGQRYLVRSNLGRGGMGSVYRVHDEHLNEEVALKLLDSRDASAQERFRQEVRLARRITHSNVARTHDIGNHEGCCFLTMELVRGATLDNLISKQGALATEQAVDIAAQVGRGLAAAHQAGVVHRDLKPANVLVERSRAVVTDFGIARSMVGERITMASQMLGTPHYMAPEQVLGENVGTPVDVYALGLSLFEMLTGVLPFEGETPMAVALARCRVAPVDPREYLPMPQALAELILSCLAMAPEARPTASGMVVRLGALSTKATVNTLAAGALVTPRSGIERQHQAEQTPSGASTPRTVSSPPARSSSPGAARSSSPGAARSSSPGAARSSSPGTARSITPTARSLTPNARESVPGARESSSGMARYTPGGGRISSGVASPFAPMSLGDQALVVLPFSYRGTSEHDYLGDALSQELIDVLSRTRGLKVIAFGAAEAYRNDRDPRTVGRALNVDAVVDGNVMVTNDRVRASVRLLDSGTGEQRWTDRFDRQFEDIFELQEIMAQRIADALRVEINLAPYHGEVDRETMDAYLRARRNMRAASHHHDYVEVLEVLEHCLEAAPEFQPAVAAHALVCARAWWSAFHTSSTVDWAQRAHASAERALEVAPELAETHFAAAVTALQAGDLPTTATRLCNTLGIAPTFAEAHRYLGELQCEAGRVKEGVRRLRLAVDLDSSLASSYFGLARIAALRGQRQRFDGYIGKMAASNTRHEVTRLARARYALWHGDTAWMKTLYEEATVSETDAVSLFTVRILGYVLGLVSREQFEDYVAQSAQFGNHRFSSMVGQYAVEAYAATGLLDDAFQQLEKVSQDALVDVGWLELCPLLDGLRSRPDFGAVLSRVRARAEDIWRLQRC